MPSDTKFFKPSGRSMLGIQHDSKKATAPIYGFGSADRANLSKVFLTPEHAKSDYGKNGPGPIYELKSSFGKQDNSKNPSGPLYSFGTADRFQKPSASLSKRSTSVPGPGAYSSPSSLGRQGDSGKDSAPQFGFGSSTRHHQEKVFLSAEQAKVNFGLNSPGPSAYQTKSSVGVQASSKNETAPIYGFGSEERFRYDYVDRAAKIPGAGQYNNTSAVGVQADSNKKTAPIYGFGSSTRATRDKVYVSAEHEKSHYGDASPGPASIGPNSFVSMGPQTSSQKATGYKYSFGSATRFVYSNSNNPGPGAYD